MCSIVETSNSWGRNEVADFDGDGWLDIVVTAADGYALLRGAPDGFGAPELIAELPAHSFQRDFFLLDLTANGYADLVNLEAVLLGGESPPHERRDLPSLGRDYCYGVAAVADVDADGALDLVLVCHETVAVMRGYGDGTFDEARPAATHPCDRYPVNVTNAVVLEDFDGDGVLDLLFGCGLYGYELVMLRGDGEGRFDEAWTFGNGATRAIGVGDFDGDGVRDLASLQSEHADYCPDPGVLRIHPRAGPDAPGEVRTHAVGVAPLDMAVGDLDGDGRDDIVIAHGSESMLRLLLSSEDAISSLDGSTELGGASGVTNLTLLDLDADGDLDVVASHAEAVAIYENLGSGTFGPRQTHVLDTW